MKAAAAPNSYRAALEGWEVKPTIILSVSTVTLITWKCFGSPQYYLKQLSDRFVWFSDPLATAAVYHFLAALLLMAVVPALIVKFVFKESLAEYGVRFGNPVRTIRSFLVALPIIVTISYLSTVAPRFGRSIRSTAMPASRRPPLPCMPCPT